MTPRNVLTGLAVVVVIIAVVVGGYLGGWWLKKDTTDRRVGVENRNAGVQTAWRDNALHLINEADLLPESAPQRAALENEACDYIGRLTDNYRTDPRIADFEETQCA